MDISTPSTVPAITVTMILDRYERECLQDLAPRTQGDYRRHLEHLRRRFGALDVTQLEPRTFADFLNVRKGQTHRVRQLAVLSAALTIAVRRWFWLKTNVLRDVERPKGKPRDRLIADEEFHACRALAPLRVQLAMDLALLTAQRQGDIIAFKWTDIREDVIDGKRITFLHVYQSKTRKRIGIEVTSDLESVLDRCWLLKGGGKDGSQYVIPNRGGRPYTSEAFRAAWQRVRLKWERRGGANLHFHDIRALAATKCKTLEEAQMLLGHTSSAMTRRVYRRGIERVKPLRLSVIQGGLSESTQHG